MGKFVPRYSSWLGVDPVKQESPGVGPGMYGGSGGYYGDREGWGHGPEQEALPPDPPTMEEAEQRMRSRAPRNYVRSDGRILEDVCELIHHHAPFDASELEVEVTGGEVVLRGEVDDRHAKRLAEDMAMSVRGVRDVRNELRVK